MSEAFREKAIKRRLLKLMQREKQAAWLVERGRAKGSDMGHLTAEVLALRWALEELGRLYPSDAAEARSDVERFWRPPVDRRGA